MSQLGVSLEKTSLLLLECLILRAADAPKHPMMKSYSQMNLIGEKNNAKTRLEFKSTAGNCMSGILSF
jgi:hypothetical protein